MTDYSYSRLFRSRKDWCRLQPRYEDYELPIPTAPFGTYKSNRNAYRSWAQWWSGNTGNIIYINGYTGRKMWGKRTLFRRRKRPDGKFA